MTDSLHLLHPEAIPHLPIFITAPGETDVLFVVNAIFVLMAVTGLGLFYFKLHALPEQLAHRGQKIQFQLVAVLGLLALFTHNHAFWIAGLLLALVPLPDFTTPLGTIARSLERLADAAQPAAVPPTEPSREVAAPIPSATPAREAPPSTAGQSPEPKED
ncbi:hypothetical protein [Allochromatium vinosum]|uniref:Uncharacterized protein n=1 Tax=Allochromatium vinosum (strain ATCC 17899 / DSM 180 / NBRC 103801 / NCIMB 10441 / D) TaxID=572477 RepID=D3RST1_ALLVD|nr:hypothetical protein [Allochromatium vinosum]ADC62240.1 conserved hypothetical protein [Allochromatium vinosum DSM 180]